MAQTIPPTPKQGVTVFGAPSAQEECTKYRDSLLMPKLESCSSLTPQNNTFVS